LARLRAVRAASLMGVGFFGIVASEGRVAWGCVGSFKGQI
jgi:hypothetical protein